MPDQNIWVFHNKRTNPATIHRFTPSGEPCAVVVHLLRQQDTDNTTGVEAVMLSAPAGTACVAHLSPDWEAEDWTLNRYPHGTLYVGENEYDDPHAVLAAAELKRYAAVQADLEPVAAEGIAASELNANGEPPAQPVFDPRDVNKDGVVSRKERKRFGN